MRLYRVFPWLEAAKEGESGHPLHVPTVQGAGRVDNPQSYLVLYVSDAAPGAIAEAFGNLAVWSEEMFLGPRALPESVRALGVYDLEDTDVLDLDDAWSLLDRDLRPSQIVTRSRAVTQAWSLRVYEENRWDGLRWWSYFDPDWGSYGLWNVARLRVVDISRLDRQHLAVAVAERALHRVWRGSHRRPGTGSGGLTQTPRTTSAEYLHFSRAHLRKLRDRKP